MELAMLKSNFVPFSNDLHYEADSEHLRNKNTPTVIKNASLGAWIPNRRNERNPASIEGQAPRAV